VNNTTTRRWEDAFNSLLDDNPQVVQQLIHNAQDVEFFKVWHRYGLDAQGPERIWAEKYGSHPGLKPQGILAMEFLRRGLKGETWESAMNVMTGMLLSRKQPNGRWMKFRSQPPFSPKQTPPEAS